MSYQRVVMTRFGGPDVFALVTEPDVPTPQAGEVRIRMLATSACFTDTMIRKGVYPGIKQKPPFALGYDLVGIVDACGEGVVNLREGQRVAALTLIGAYAEYLCVLADSCVPVPAGLDPAEAVSLVLTYMTAYQMIHRVANVPSGARMLVHGASGAVGTALLQLGQIHGAELYGTVSSSAHDLVSAMGAVPIDYQNEDFGAAIDALEPRGVDVVFDAIGGSHFKRSFRCLRKGGMVVAYGAYNAAIGKGGGALWGYTDLLIRGWLTRGRSATIYSITALKAKHPDWFRKDLIALLHLLEQGRIRPVISARFPLHKAADAHRMLEARSVKGKIVLLSEGQATV